MANQISQMMEVSHRPMASGTGCRIRYRRKKARTTRRSTMTIRYGLTLLDAIDTFLDSGCLASSFSGTSASMSSGSTAPRMPCLDFQSSILSFQLTSFFSSHFALPGSDTG
uniref:CesA12 n=1 Tax=Arundo donax TaxID=35708 RepID=A0A0A9E3A0_ARUDO